MRVYGLLGWVASLLLIASPVPTVAASFGRAGECARIEEEALAPPSAGVLRAFDPVRILWVRLEQELGADSAAQTPVHRAIKEIERLLQAGQPRQAMMLSEVLALDLAIARWTGSIHQLMDEWNSRFPSDLALDVTGVELNRLDAALDQILAAPAYTAAQTPIEALFTEWIWRSRFEDPESQPVTQGFESHADMLEALANALDLETTYNVRFPKAARKSFVKRSPLSVTIFGLRTVGWIMTTMEDSHPWLKGTRWQIRIDGKISKNARDVIHPNQRLSMVLPRSA